MIQMTYCDRLTETLKEKIVQEEMSLDDIGRSLCGDTVKDPRRKAIRLVKVLLGPSYLKKHADTLGYDAKRAVREKPTSEEPVKRNFASKDDGETDDFEKLVRKIRRLAEQYGLDDVIQAVEVIQEEGE